MILEKSIFHCYFTIKAFGIGIIKLYDQITGIIVSYNGVIQYLCWKKPQLCFIA